MSKNSSIILTVAAAAFAVAAIFLGIPAIIYAANEGEFAWPFDNVLVTYWPWAAGLAVVFIVPSLMLPPIWSRRWAATVAVLAIYVWAHGVFQTHQFGAIDGRDWSASVPLWQSLAEGVIVIIAAILAWIFAYRAQKAATVLQLFLAVGLILQAWPVLSASEWRDIPDETRMAEAATFSTEANALIVLMDTMTSEVFEEVVMETPALRAALDGFVSYPETVGAAPTTYLSMPTIHSGRVYEDGTKLGTFFDDSVENHSVLTKVAEAGYQGVLVNPVRVCPKNITCFNSHEAMTGNLSSVRANGMAVLDAVLFRLAPLALKKAVYNDGEWVFQKWTQDSRFVQRAVEGNHFLREMSESLSTSSDKPTLKFIHLYTTHPPYIYRDDCRYAGRELKVSHKNFARQVKCSLESFAVLLQALKTRGIYDRTAIVLIADHGNYQVPSNRASGDEAWRVLVASANPTFAVKPIGQTGEFRTGGGEVYIGDLGATLCDLLKVCTADNGVSALRESTDRARIFNYYRWKHEYWYADSIEFSRYEVRGSIADPRSWTQVGGTVEGASVNIGGTIDFSSKGDSSRYVLDGWSQPEPWGTWTDGRLARLTLQSSGSGPLQLTLSAQGFTGGGPMRASVFIDEHPVGDLAFDAANPPRDVTFAVPPEVADDGAIIVEFRIAEPRSPKELGLSADSRMLGIGIRWLRLGPIAQGAD